MRVRAASVNPADWHLIRGASDFRRALTPKGTLVLRTTRSGKVVISV
jgi:NADPH:quinone reductase-like Zn-dependent oxidoreductase